jgi:hypothetical protein
MDSFDKASVESENISDFFNALEIDTCGRSSSFSDGYPQAGRMNIDADNVRNGLAQLVLTLVKLLHELLERQAIRRIETGYLCDDEIERLGFTLMRQAEEIENLRKQFDLKEEDLNLDLGPLGKLL